MVNRKQVGNSASMPVGQSKNRGISEKASLTERDCEEKCLGVGPNWGFSLQGQNNRIIVDKKRGVSSSAGKQNVKQTKTPNTFQESYWSVIQVLAFLPAESNLVLTVFGLD